jgi:hypothetical protein
MRSFHRLLLTATTLTAAISGAGACVRLDAATVEREVTRAFTVTPGATVSVEISGGGIVLRRGPADVVKVVLTETIQADSDRAADDRLGQYDIALGQTGQRVDVRARRKTDGTWGWRDGVSFHAEVEAPADAVLDLRTSGGRIEVEGERTAPVLARTSGGSVRVDGSSADIDVRTSGGSIDVGRALGRLSARTSGGSIRVNYVGAASHEVQLDTSGGSITAAVDRRAAFDIEARTSGGSVHVNGLAGTGGDRDRDRGRSRFSGAVNGGGSPFGAHTSGGSIRISGTE